MSRIGKKPINFKGVTVTKTDGKVKVKGKLGELEMKVHPNIKVDITTHGSGMLPYMANLMKEKDQNNLLWNEDGTPHPSHIKKEYMISKDELNTQTLEVKNAS